MTDAYLLSLALRPRITIPLKRDGRSWEKQCILCPQAFYDDCKALNLAGLPVRCQRIDDEERAKLEGALRWAQ